MSEDFLNLAPATDEDIPFLRELYCVSRDYEIVHYPWPESDKRAFLEWQFELQFKGYLSNYPGAEFSVVSWQGQKVGRWYVHRSRTDLRLMEVTFLREFRGRGFGTALITALKSEAIQKGARVSLHVEPYNPALLLYQKLGFTVEGQVGHQYYMEWWPEGVERIPATHLDPTA